MEKLKTSPAEVLKTVHIQTIEYEQLNRVFDFLKTRDTTKTENLDKISSMDIARTLQFLGCKPTRAEVELIIWEVDDDLDGFVSRQEFEIMYKRCISDSMDLEPRQLYNLVTFLMYDKDFRGRVTIEETLQILFVRHGRKNLDEEIKAIFGDEQRDKDTSEEQSITYSEYVEKITRRALKRQAGYLGKRKKDDQEDSQMQ
eukprot:Macronucleus_3405.p2 GENE.Macronucleus_3405~~Macronucleus_3405.p2  ORF type:complete len:200 (+),score=70.96 Macronucleus_3405:1-600(+)